MKKYKLCLKKSISLESLATDEIIELGYFYDTTQKTSLMEIILLDDCYNKTGSHCSVNHFEAGEFYNEPANVCAISVQYYENWFLQSPKFLEALFAHELGHVINGDILRYTEKNNKLRISQVRKASVQLEELEADEFAASLVGIDLFIEFLKEMVKKRQKRNDQGAILAIAEFIKRIEHLENIKSHI